MVDGGWGLGFSGSNLGFGTHCPSIYIQPFLREGGGITQYKLLMDRGLPQTCEIIEISPFYDFSHFSCGISHTTHKPLTYTDLHKVCRENIFHSFYFSCDFLLQDTLSKSFLQGLFLILYLIDKVARTKSHHIDFLSASLIFLECEFEPFTFYHYAVLTGLEDFIYLY